MKKPSTIVGKLSVTCDNPIRSVTRTHAPSFLESLKSDEYISHMAAIVESSDDAIISKSLEGIIKTWNKGGEKMFGFTAAEAVGKPVSIIIPPEYRAEERSIIERISRNEIINHYETVRNKKNGERLFVSLTESPLRNKEGKIIGISKIARDITARKQAEIEISKINKQLVDQNREKEFAAAELQIANRELGVQFNEKEKRAAELFIANKELVHQNQEKEKRAAELVVANKELAFQNREKEKRAAELVVANKELAFQNEEKEKRAAELKTANKELAFQNGEKEKRAAELSIANIELVFQNKEKEQRADELILANRELAFQNDEKEKREHELTIAIKELAVQETKLKKHNKELEQFAYVASHDLQEPLRTVSNYMHVFAEDYMSLLDNKAMTYLNSVNSATERMSMLIKSLLEFSRLGNNSKIVCVDCSVMLAEVIQDLDTVICKSKTIIEFSDMPRLNLYEVEIRQVFQNLITNAIKFQKKETQPIIRIRYAKINEVHTFSVSDNGIGIDPSHFDRIFEIFQRLPTLEKYDGNGIGLANCKKIIQLHQGEIHVESTLNVGTTIHFTIGNLLPI